MSTKSRYTPYTPHNQNLVQVAGVTTATHQYGAGVSYNAGYWNPRVFDLGYKSEMITTSGTARKRFNSVDHEIVDYQLYPVFIQDWYEYSHTGHATVSSGGNFSAWTILGQIPIIGTERVSVSYPRTNQQLINAAADRFYSANVTDNLLNAVEFRQLRDGFAGSLKTIDTVVDLINRFASKKALKRALARTLRELNGQYLAYSFGYAPLISDLKKLDRGLSRLGKDLESLSKSSRVVIGTAQVDGTSSVSMTGLSGYTDTPPSTPDLSWWSSNFSSKATKTVGCVGRHTRSYRTQGFRNLDYVLARYGGTGPVSLAWELVPFSFVLDWFVDIKPLVNSLDNTFTGATKKIDYFWSSEKQEYVCLYKKHRGAAFSYAGAALTQHELPIDGAPLGYTSVKKYHRNILEGSPMISASDRFGKKQFTLGGALFYQKVANLLSRAR